MRETEVRLVVAIPRLMCLRGALGRFVFRVERVGERAVYINNLARRRRFKLSFEPT